MAQNTCIQCGNKIPTYSSKNKLTSQNRKRCFDCSPFGRKGKSLPAGQKVAKRMENYYNWPDEWKKEHCEKIKKKSDGVKQKLVDFKGGKCEKCGYAKCLNALQFHHLDPKQKKFGLDKNSILRNSWDLILIELEKCELLCANCHAETHS
jgi:hypothetical protein